MNNMWFENEGKEDPSLLGSSHALDTQLTVPEGHLRVIVGWARGHHSLHSQPELQEPGCREPHLRLGERCACGPQGLPRAPSAQLLVPMAGEAAEGWTGWVQPWDLF